MRLNLLVSVLALVACACGGVTPSFQTAPADPLCEALADVRSSGLSASLSAPARLAAPEHADARAQDAHAALRRFRAAAPADIRGDARRVTRSLGRFVDILNDPAGAPGAMVQWFAEGPAEHDALVASAKRVNAVTQDRCGEPLVDPATL